MTENTPHTGWLSAGRVLVLALVGVIIVLGVILIVMAVGESDEVSEGTERINALANSDNECVECHKRNTPGIVQQFGFSTMAAADVECQDCHEVSANYPGAVEHEGTYVLNSPTTTICQNCHTKEVKEFLASRHGLPAYVAYNGTVGLTDDQLAEYQAIPEGSFAPDKERNALYELEGEAVTEFACEVCHNVGQPALDGSTGQCQKCHLRHEFSLEQARKPETCNQCHIGPDHPQWEIYVESPHGIAYNTMGHTWNWDAEPGTLTVEDIPAATCAVCHISGFGESATTHDVGERLTWYLFASVSARRPAWESNRVRMQGVCLECHNDNFIDDFYTRADAATEQVNAWVEESNAMVQPLMDNGLMGPPAFDEPIDFVYFELWHHWGRTAKFGAWMQGPDYTQWHGAYELLSDLAELKALVNEALVFEEMREAGLMPQPPAPVPDVDTNSETDEASDTDPGGDS